MEIATIPVGARQKIWKTERDHELREISDHIFIERIGHSDLPPEATILIPEGRTVTFCFIQTERVDGAYKRQFSVQENAHLRVITVLFGAPQLEVLQEVYLEGRQSSAHQSILCISRATDDVHCVINSDHVVGQSQSEMIIRRVLMGSSVQTINTMVQIEAGAQGSDGRLDDKAYLLSAGVRNRCIPGLEIDANDVKASHSSSQTRLHSDEILYANSRGIPTTEAQLLLVDGFAAKVYEEIEDQALREQIQSLLREQLDNE